MNERIIVHPPGKDKKGKYFITVSYYFNGIRKQKRKTGFEKSKDAKAAGEEIKKKLLEDMPVIKATGTNKVTFEDFATQIITLRSGSWSPNTIRIRKSSLNYCDFKNKELGSITALDVETNIVELKRTYSYNTVFTCVSSWNLFFNQAVKYNMLIKNPNVSVIEKPKNDNKVKALSLEDANALLDKITDSTIWLFTLIGFSCGQRRGELLDLNLKDFDLQAHTLTISHQYSKTENGYLRDQPLKTQNSYRTVPISKRIADAIKNNSLVGINGEIFTENLLGIAKKANKIYKKLGYKITCHGLRHTYVTNLITSNQFDIQSIAKMAGDTVNTTLKTYSHYLVKTQEENVKKIEALFG